MYPVYRGGVFEYVYTAKPFHRVLYTNILINNLTIKRFDDGLYYRKM